MDMAMRPLHASGRQEGQEETGVERQGLERMGDHDRSSKTEGFPETG